MSGILGDVAASIPLARRILHFLASCIGVKTMLRPERLLRSTEVPLNDVDLSVDFVPCPGFFISRHGRRR